MKMSNIWSPIYPAPHPSTVSGLSSLGDKIMQAIYYEYNSESRKFKTNNYQNKIPGWKTDFKQHFNVNCLLREELTVGNILKKGTNLSSYAICHTQVTNLENNNQNSQTSLNNITTVDDLFDCSISTCTIKPNSQSTLTEIVDETTQINRNEIGCIPSPDMEFDEGVLYSKPYVSINKNKDLQNKSDITKFDGDYTNKSSFNKNSQIDSMKNSNKNEFQYNFMDSTFSVDDLFTISQMKESQKYKNNLKKDNIIKDQCFKMVDSKKKPQLSGKKETLVEKHFKGNTKITSYFQSVSLGKKTGKNNFYSKSSDFTKNNPFKISSQPKINTYCIDTVINKTIGINNETKSSNGKSITQPFNREISCKTDTRVTGYESCKDMSENKQLQQKDSNESSALSVLEQNLLPCLKNKTNSNVLNQDSNSKKQTIDIHGNKSTMVFSCTDLFSPVVSNDGGEINNIFNKNELFETGFENFNLHKNRAFLLPVLSDLESEKNKTDGEINKMDNIHREVLSQTRSIDLFASQDSFEINKCKTSYTLDNIGDFTKLDQNEKHLENNSDDVTICRAQNHKMKDKDNFNSVIRVRFSNYEYDGAKKRQKDGKPNSGLDTFKRSNQNKIIHDKNPKTCDDFKENERKSQGDIKIECDKKNVGLSNTEDKSKEKQNINNLNVGKIESNTFNLEDTDSNDKNKYKDVVNSNAVHEENEKADQRQDNLEFQKAMKSNITINTSHSPPKKVKYNTVTKVKFQNNDAVNNQSVSNINKPQFKGVLQFFSTKSKNKTGLDLKNKTNIILDENAEKIKTKNDKSNEIKKTETHQKSINLVSKRNKMENSKNKSVTIPELFNKKFSKSKFSRNYIDVKKSENQIVNKKKIFVPPLKKITETQELPTQINSYNNFITLDDQNIALMEEKLKHYDIKQIAITLVYREGYTLLNKPTSLKVTHCYPDGLMMLVSWQDCCEYWYCNVSTSFWSDKSLQQVRAFMDCLFSRRCKGRKICYEAQAVSMLILDSFQFKVYDECKLWTIEDPMIGCWLLNPDNPPQNFKKALENLGMDLNLMEPASGCVAKSQACILLPILGLMMDCVRQKLIEASLWSLFIDMETKVLPILAVMECQSICVDKNKLEEAAVALEKRLCQVQEAAYKAAGRPFHINSHVQLRQILYNELQLDTKHSIKIKQTTQQGSKSTSEPMLKLLENVHPLPKIILEHRQLQKIKSTYVDGILQHLQKDNTVSTTWEQIGAATGRITSSNPNLQAVPKQAINLEGAIISPRASFIPRKSCSFLAADFKHIEFRVFAHYTQDEDLLRTFRDSDDIFETLAHMWLGQSNTTERDKTKKIVYSVMYGAGAAKVAEYLHVDIDEANRIINSFLCKFPFLRTLSHKVINQCRVQGYLHTIAGRLRLFPNINSTNPALRSYSERQAINFLIQGSAADICKAAMLNCEASLSSPSLGSKLLLQIHDELLWEVADDQLHIVGEKVKLAMECNQQWGELRVPIPVTISVGKNWADLKPLQDVTNKFDI